MLDTNVLMPTGCSGWDFLKKEDPSETNLFRFIEKHSLQISQKPIPRDNPYYVFNLMKESLQACSPGELLEKKLHHFEQNLLGMARLAPRMSKAFGLATGLTQRKILQDARSYLTMPGELTFSNEIDVTTRAEFAKEIEALVAETIPQKVGDVCNFFVSDHTEMKIFECKKLDHKKYVISLAKIEQPLTSEQKTALTTSLKTASLSDTTISKLLFGYEHNWKGFIYPSLFNPGLFVQTHKINRVKIYKNINGALIADVAIRNIKNGSIKGTKSEIKLLPKGIITELVRYKPNKSSRSVENAFHLFSLEMNHEMEVRTRMGNIPHLLSIQESGSYVSKKRWEKKRYEALSCAGSLSDYINDENPTPRPLNEKETRQTLLCCADALRALVAMHKNGFVHKDVKLSNILYLKDSQGLPTEGVLADLGFTVHVSEKYVDSCTIANCPPEILLRQATENAFSMDMFSFGTVLLGIYRPDLREDLEKLQGGKSSHPQYKALSLKEYLEGLTKIQKVLHIKGDTTKNSDLESLIGDLLSSNPKERPDSSQTLEKLEEFLKKVTA